MICVRFHERHLAYLGEPIQCGVSGLFTRVEMTFGRKSSPHAELPVMLLAIDSTDAGHTV